MMKWYKYERERICSPNSVRLVLLPHLRFLRLFLLHSLLLLVLLLPLPRSPLSILLPFFETGKVPEPEGVHGAEAVLEMIL